MEERAGGRAMPLPPPAPPPPKRPAHSARCHDRASLCSLHDAVGRNRKMAERGGGRGGGERRRRRVHRAHGSYAARRAASLTGGHTPARTTHPHTDGQTTLRRALPPKISEEDASRGGTT